MKTVDIHWAYTIHFFGRCGTLICEYFSDAYQSACYTYNTCLDHFSLDALTNGSHCRVREQQSRIAKRWLKRLVSIKMPSQHGTNLLTMQLWLTRGTTLNSKRSTRKHPKGAKALRKTSVARLTLNTRWTDWALPVPYSRLASLSLVGDLTRLSTLCQASWPTILDGYPLLTILIARFSISIYFSVLNMDP